MGFSEASPGLQIHGGTDEHLLHASVQHELSVRHCHNPSGRLHKDKVMLREASQDLGDCWHVVVHSDDGARLMG